jgi:adenylylsulfate kinase
MKILVMGLPGSGKTYLTERLVPLLNAAWYNADKVREMANDWDFSDEGRNRQSMRMKTFADFEKSHGRFVICDFVCPTEATRENFHITEWNEHNHDDLAKEILKNV